MRALVDLWGHIAPRGRRLRWVLVAAVGAAVSAMEIVIAGLVFSVLQLAASGEDDVTLPLFGSMSDLLGTDSPGQLLTALAIVAGTAFLLRSALFAAHVYAQTRLAYSAGVSLSDRLLRTYMAQPYEWHVRQNSGDLAGDVLPAVQQVLVQVVVPVLAGISQALLTAALVGLLLVADPGTTVVAGAFLGAAVAMLLRAIQPTMRRIGREQIDQYKRSLQTVQEGLQAIREVKILDLSDRFAGQLWRQRRLQIRADYLAATLSALPRVVLETTAIIAVLTFVAIQGPTAEDGAGLATLGLFGYVLLRLLPTVTSLVRNITLARYGAGALSTVLRGLALDGESTRTDGQRPLPECLDLRLSRVSFAYGDEPILREVTVEIPEGLTIGLVGTTGSGKSTLLDVISGLLAPTGGAITVGDVAMHDVIATWQQILGVVPQFPTIIDDTVQANIELGSRTEIDEAKMEEIIEIAQLRHVIDGLPQGLDTMLGERGVRLSGGQRQRIALARALYRRPRVLVLDEGTSALDGATEHLVMEAIRSRSETVIMAAHRLSTIEYCDTVLVLDGGRVVAEGTVAELRSSSPHFQRLHLPEKTA